MYYQSYEDYMRSVLGYPVENNCTYETNYSPMMYNANTIQNQDTKEIENMYPEIYRTINPIVCEICDNFNQPINNETIDKMVEEIYQKIDVDNEVNININIDSRDSKKSISQVENRQRRPNNPFLRDLIRILILNRLLGRFFPPRPPHRPNFPSSGRPPFSGGSGGITSIPPMLRNENYNNYF